MQQFTRFTHIKTDLTALKCDRNRNTLLIYGHYMCKHAGFCWFYKWQCFICGWCFTC